MAQRKETKKQIKVRDLKPRKDAKGGSHMVFGQRQQTSGHNFSGTSHQQTSSTHGNT